jgi:hypothetical protein
VQPGPLTGHAVALIIQQRAKAAGLDPKVFSGRSLRAGYVTTAAGVKGASLHRIADQTRHQSLEMVRVYIRRANDFQDHSGASFL